MLIAPNQFAQANVQVITFVKVYAQPATTVPMPIVQMQFAQTNAKVITLAQANAKNVANAKTFLVPNEYVHTNALDTTYVIRAQFVANACITQAIQSTSTTNAKVTKLA